MRLLDTINAVQCGALKLANKTAEGLDSIKGAMDSVVERVDTVGCDLDSVTNALKEIGTTIDSTYKMIEEMPAISAGEWIMAGATLCAVFASIGITIWQTKKHNKEIIATQKEHRNEMEYARQKHLLELKLERVEKKYERLKDHGYKYWNNEVLYDLETLGRNIVEEGYYKQYEKDLKELYKKIIDGYNSYYYDLKYYGLKEKKFVFNKVYPGSENTEVVVKKEYTENQSGQNTENDNVELGIVELSSQFSKYLIYMRELVVFFREVNIDKNNQGEDIVKMYEEDVQYCFKNEGKLVYLNPSDFSEFCEEHCYDINEIEVNLESYWGDLCKEMMITNNYIIKFVEEIIDQVIEERKGIEKKLKNLKVSDISKNKKRGDEK